MTITSTKIWLQIPTYGGNEQLSNVKEAFDNELGTALSGTNVNRFEVSIKSYLNNERFHVAALSSGTAAIHLWLVLPRGFPDMVTQ